MLPTGRTKYQKKTKTDQIKKQKQNVLEFLKSEPNFIYLFLVLFIYTDFSIF